MAVTASGLFVSTFVAALGTTQLALDLDAETHKIATFSNSITPNFTTDTAYGTGTYGTNEVTGTNWASGGVTLTGTTLAGASGTATFDATDVSVATVTLSGARCGVIYANALGGKNLIGLLNFGADYSPTAGTFEIVWNAAGIAYIDLTP